MSHVEPIQVGRIQVEVVCEGWAPLALADECPGQTVDWSGERERHPWAFAGDGAWPWHVHAFVVRTFGGVVLVDTGVGAFGPYSPWAQEQPDAWSGIDASAVDHVVLTHLHADHAGGSVAGGSPRVPNATHHLHPGDWTFFAGLDDADEYAARHALEVVAAGSGLDLEPLDHEIVPGVMVRHAPGHTPGHRSVVVRDGDDTLLLTGDLLHTPASAEHPTWPSSHDVDPQLGTASRQMLLWLARTGNWRIAVSHFAEPFGRLDADGWRRG
jgi:glyoxylase-like metal-dependent hydrolase (beta-lactamase superfamily II)